MREHSYKVAVCLVPFGNPFTLEPVLCSHAFRLVRQMNPLSVLVHENKEPIGVTPTNREVCKLRRVRFYPR